MLHIDVVGARANLRSWVKSGLFAFRLHAAERNVGFWDLAFSLDFEIVGAYFDVGVPGPTLGFTLAVWLGFSPLNTKAINFIIIEVS